MLFNVSLRANLSPRSVVISTAEENPKALQSKIF